MIPRAQQSILSFFPSVQAAGIRRTFASTSKQRRQLADPLKGYKSRLPARAGGKGVMLRPDNVRKDMPLPSKLDHQLMFDILMAPIAHPAVTRKDIEVHSSDIETYFASREKTVDNFETLLELQTYKGAYEQAAQTIDIMKELGFPISKPAYNQVMLACGKGKRRDLIARFFMEAKEVYDKGEGDKHLYTTAIRAFGQAGELDQAWNLILEVERNFQMPKDVVLYTAFIQSCIEQKEHDRAWQAYWWMRDRKIDPDPITYSLMMHMCGETDRTERAFLFLEEMDKAKMPLIEGNYNALIHACAKRNDVCIIMSKNRESLRPGLEMKLDGYIPDIVTYNCLLNVCSRRGDIEACELIFDEMMDKRTDTFQPNTTTYGLMLYCYASSMKNTPKELREGIVRKAEKLFASLLGSPEHKITSQTLNSLLRMYANADMTQTATDFFAKYAYKIKNYFPEMWEEVGNLCDWTRDHNKTYYAPKVFNHKPRPI